MPVQKQYTSIGGQAVIEGVMMRSPHFISVAVRKPNHRIILQTESYSSLSLRIPFFKKPFLRGIIILFESLVKGTQTLSYSASVAAESELDGEPLSARALVGSILLALLLGVALFVALPHFLTVVIFNQSKTEMTAESPLFHLLDGGIKVLILLIYVYTIAFMKDIRRVFQYHGAEHKSIYTFEAGEPLTVENASKHSVLHPRCGTSFLLFLVLMSILVFSIFFPVFKLTTLSPLPILNHIWMVIIKVLLMVPVSGFAYEFIKACSFRMNNPLFYTLVWPGLILQKLTTREPDSDQLEVALVSLRQVLKLEQERNADAQNAEKKTFEIAGITELPPVFSSVSDFREI